MNRFTVRLADGRLFHFKIEADADRFAAKYPGATRVPFSIELLPADLRERLGV